MKIKSLYIAASLSLILSGCSGIAEDDRYIEVEATKAERTVLLEDFTGQDCVYCPNGHRVIEALEEQYGNHFIAVSIHAGNLSFPTSHKFFVGLGQEEGQIYNDRYGINDYPKGVVNGKLPATNPDQWAAAVYNDISEATPLSINLDAALSDDNTEINIACSLTSSEQINGNIVVWVIESSIVARQKDINEGVIKDYVHNNVFRACVNGVDGDKINIPSGKTINANYKIAVKDEAKEKWIPENLAIVAFVTDGSGVVQAAKTNVNTNI